MQVALGTLMPAGGTGVFNATILAAISSEVLALCAIRFGRARHVLLSVVSGSLLLYVAFVLGGGEMLPDESMPVLFRVVDWWTFLAFYGYMTLAAALLLRWVGIRTGLVCPVFRLGVVGYCPPSTFDEEEAKRLVACALREAREQHPRRKIMVVSGLSDVGVLALAYRHAVELGWKTAGIAPKRALESPCFPVAKRRIIGKEYGDESDYFLCSIDGIVKIGGGKQSEREFDRTVLSGGYARNYPLEKLN